MACGGDYIYSESNAITGSIGVLALFLMTAPLEEFLEFIPIPFYCIIMQP